MQDAEPYFVIGNSRPFGGNAVQTPAPVGIPRHERRQPYLKRFPLRPAAPLGKNQTGREKKAQNAKHEYHASFHAILLFLPLIL
jgi:hypothetical protein